MNYSMGTYIFTSQKRTLKKKKRFNRFYGKKYTKRELAGRVLLARLFLAIFIAIGITGTFLQAKNEYQFNGGAVSASPTVEPLNNGKVFHSLPIEAVKIETVEEQIRRIAKEQNFQWTDYLIRLAKCESTLNPQALNINKNGSRDRGIFQINNQYHPSVSDEQAFDVEFSTLWTIQKISEGKQNIWVCNPIILKK